MTNHVNDQFLSSLQIDINEAREFNSFYKRYAPALTNISEAKEHSTNGGFLCEEKQAIQTSNDISEAHEAFYNAILKRFK